MSTPTPTGCTPKRIGFISTRFRGTDGVTLEARKWATILEDMGHTCHWMAGQLDAPAGRSYEAPLAYFGHPEVDAVQARLFDVTSRSRAITNQIQALKEQLKDELYHFIRKFDLEVLIPENILAIPMHVPLGLAMTEVIAETTLPVIAHHHDFAWERERFTLNGVNDYLASAFPRRSSAWSTWSSIRWRRRNSRAASASRPRSSPTSWSSKTRRRGLTFTTPTSGRRSG